MAATDSLSSCAPHPNSQSPPMAHAPKPMGVMDRSEFPSTWVLMTFFESVFTIVVPFVVQLAYQQRLLQIEVSSSSGPNPPPRRRSWPFFCWLPSRKSLPDCFLLSTLLRSSRPPNRERRRGGGFGH